MKSQDLTGTISTSSCPALVHKTIPVCRAVWVWLLLVAVCTTSFAFKTDRTITQYVHTAWGQKEGAPSGVLALAQTADGFLWLGCVDGLYRFDGVTFELRRPGITYALLALPGGDLWIGRKSAVSLLRNGQITDYTVNDGVPAGKVASFAEDSEGTLWMASSAGLARLEGNRWKQVGSDWNVHEAYVTGMLLDRQGTFWVAAGHTILYLPHGSQQFHTTGITTTQVWTLVEAPNGKLWMSETSRSVRLIPLGRDLPPSDKTEFVIGSIGILFDRDGALWITSAGQGMRRAPSPERMDGRKFDQNDHAMESFTEADGLADNLITAILEDREGNIWVGTNSGLDRFYKGKLVPIIVPFPVVGPVMAPGSAGSVWVDSIEHAFHIETSGRVFILTSEGGSYFDVYRGPDGALWWQRAGFLDRVEPGSTDRSRARRIPTPIDPIAKTHQALKITEDGNGVIWAASESAGVYTFEKTSIGSGSRM
jgi:ligand-binding sensor domain-containing protein